MPLHVGDPSTIKHVFLIIKENRTYDQVLGDDPRGNGDPSLAQFGGPVTPHHPPVAATASTAEKAWAAWSAKQNFRTEDMVNMDQENRDIWYATHHFAVPYPGDKAVLLPDQVPGASAPADSAASTPSTVDTDG